MAEAKDPAIKLFGKTIPLQPDNIACSQPHDVELTSAGEDVGPAEDDVAEEEEEEEDRASVEEEGETDDDTGDQDRNTSHVKQVGVSFEAAENIACQDASLGTTDNPEALSGVEESAAAEPTKSGEETTETSAPQDKTPKKPDKILPCPRCNSMDTKFCYYNNYNVNQPRHFCKNCQRYWTAGGTMRNVPVGAGRRKNKSSASHYRHISIPEALQNARPDITNGVHPGLQPNGTVLTFGTDPPLCESMASILNLAEKTMMNCTPNNFRKPEEVKIPIPFVAMESGSSQLNGSSLKDDGSKSALKEPAAQSCLPFPPQIPCYPGAPWPYPWNSAQWSPPVAAPPFCPNGLAMPFYPAPGYWGCTVPGTWSIPWIAQPSPSQSNPSSGPSSPTLGKHTRDGNMLTSTNPEEKETGDNSSERSLWIPKTLRIDDPGEAARSSIWSTLGIKNNDKPESIGRGSGLFKAFQSKCDTRNPNLEKSTVLEANPAALSRSQNFQENS